MALVANTLHYLSSFSRKSTETIVIAPSITTWTSSDQMQGEREGQIPPGTSYRELDFSVWIDPIWSSVSSLLHVVGPSGLEAFKICKM
jgi:hypothetical protein